MFVSCMCVFVHVHRECVHGLGGFDVAAFVLFVLMLLFSAPPPYKRGF